MKFHFISGLPRSGSTLLAAILRRNPCLHAGMTSPFGALFNGMLAMWSAGLPALLDLFPSSKLIACVRNVAWVMDSRERLFRANPYENTRLFNDDSERVAVESRRTVLPPDLFEKFPALSFWHARPGSAANVIRLANAPTPDLASVKGS